MVPPGMCIGTSCRLFVRVTGAQSLSENSGCLDRCRAVCYIGLGTLAHVLACAPGQAIPQLRGQVCDLPKLVNLNGSTAQLPGICWFLRISQCCISLQQP